MKLLTELYNISAPSYRENKMIRFITNMLDEMNIPYVTDQAGNIYATKGKADTYPCIVAHTDEVHSKHTKGYEVVNFRNELIFGYDSLRRQHAGIGADDKNGIWICLKVLKRFKNVKCAFFTAEEVGCIGSRQANMSFFKDCRFVIQCDRKGSSDVIYNVNGLELCSREFLKDVNMKEFGYKKERGAMTDVMMLKQKGLKVSCVNISCGYYYPHTEHEFTNIYDLHNCFEFVCNIVRNCRKVYPHTKPERKPVQFRNSLFDGLGSYGGFRSTSENRSKNNDWDEPIHRTYSRQIEIEEFTCLMGEMLAMDQSLSIAQLRDLLKDDYPYMTPGDYRTAYEEIMGCPPPADFPKTNLPAVIIKNELLEEIAELQ